jgi:hypothetical protein
VDGTIKWSGNSAWYVVETIESFNGYATNFISGTFIWWFAANGFGGSNYSNTPVGAVTHVEEPSLGGVNNASVYFGLWAGGKNFAICAWNSRGVPPGNYPPELQAVGDPFVRR